jgi:hypothetical protein
MVVFEEKLFSVELVIVVGKDVKLSPTLIVAD